MNKSSQFSRQKRTNNLKRKFYTKCENGVPSPVLAEVDIPLVVYSVVSLNLTKL